MKLRVALMRCPLGHWWWPFHKWRKEWLNHYWCWIWRCQRCKQIEHYYGE